MITSIDQATSAQAQSAQHASLSAGSGGDGSFAAVLGQALRAQASSFAAARQDAIQTNLPGVDSAQAVQDATDETKRSASLALQSLNLQASIAASRGDAGTFTVLAFIMTDRMREMGLLENQTGTVQAPLETTTAKAASARASARTTASKRSFASVTGAAATSAAQAAASSASTTSSAQAALTDSIISNAATSQTAASSNANSASCATAASNAITSGSAALASGDGLVAGENDTGTAKSLGAAAGDASAPASISQAQSGTQGASSESPLDTLTQELKTLLAALDNSQRAQALSILEELAASPVNAT